MKKTIMIMMMFLASLSINAIEPKISTVSKIEDKTLIENNIRKSYFEESNVKIVFILDTDETIYFNVYEKYIKDDKIYLIGTSNINCNIISLQNDNIYVPISKNKKISINDKKIYNEILDLTNNVSEIYTL